MSEERNYEAEAKAEGWVPKEAFKGDESKWVDAETFVKRGEEILPIVNAKNRKLVETVDTLKKEIDDLKLGNSQFREFHEQTIAREKQQREAAIKELEALRKKAVSDGDGEAFDRAEKRINELRAQPVRTNGHSELNEAQRAWLSENRWYETDHVLRAVADGLSDALARERPELLGKRDFLDELTKRVRAEMPHKFENPNRNRTVVEDAPPRGGGNGKARAYENLPADAKVACDRFVRTIPGYTKEKYLADYQWD
jgi:hypothetical protein